MRRFVGAAALGFVTALVCSGALYAALVKLRDDLEHDHRIIDARERYYVEQATRTP